VKLPLFLRIAFVLGLVLAGPAASADPIRILIAAGSSVGAGADQTLVHPRDDARGVSEVFTTLGGVRPGDAIFVPDATGASLRAAFDRAAALAGAHPPPEVSFLFYFSGHGDHEALHVSGETVSMREIEERVAKMPAALRLVVIDACRVDSSRAKGMTSEPGFSVLLKLEPTAAGTAWLFASSAGEVAQESDDVGGALFSHFWTAGLRGAADTNGDGRVTLEESFDFAYAQTLLRSARSGAALQRPQERLELSLASPVVLTELAMNRATLVLPADRDALYLVYAATSRSLESELFAAPDRPTALALPAGRYLVQRRVGSTGGATDVLLSAGERRELNPGAFRPFANEALSLKGELLLRPWSVTAFDGAIGGIGLDAGDEAGVEVERRFGGYGVAVRAFGGWGESKTAANFIHEASAGGEVGILRVLPLSARWSATLGVEARAQWVRQEVERSDARIVERAGYAGSSYWSGTLWGGGLHFGARFDLSTHWFVAARAGALGLGAKTDTGVEGRVLLSGSIGVGAALP
jgi:hypothetical protein